MTTMIKRLVWVALGLLVLLGAGFFAVGGRAGVMLLAVKYLVRTEYGPPQAVVWQQGPASPAALAAGTTRPPNIILIVADDLGFNDITHYGGGIAGGKVPTPHIDSIARDGVEFRNGYSGNATCAPSRAAIMTGRYATRFGFEFTPTPKQFMKVVTGMAPADLLYKPVYHPEREVDLIPYEDMGLPVGEVTQIGRAHV